MLSVSAGSVIVVELLPLFNIVSTILAIAVICVCAAVAASVTKPFCKEFPQGLQTVGDLARWVMTHKADLATATAPGWTREQITIRVREIIVEQLGCKPDFSEDANFVKDLGLS